MFYSRVNQEINIVLELVEGISAAKLVAKQKPISEPLAAQVTYQLLDALKFLVRNNIVHRDVKVRRPWLSDLALALTLTPSHKTCSSIPTELSNSSTLAQ